MTDISRLYEPGPADDAHARVLVTFFDGAMDAGGAGRMAVSQLLRSLPTVRVATFDTEEFIDYRAHRPVITVEHWVTRSVETPELALDLVRDDRGQNFLVLHGPEPDMRWKTFSTLVEELAHKAGVEISFALQGIPSGVPHTRPPTIHVHGTSASLLPPQPQMAAVMQFPASMNSFVQDRLASRRIDGVSLLAAVPYYMADSGYPAAASALLGALSEYADLSLPVGDLERGAAEDFGAITSLVEGNPEVLRTVEALEQHYDTLTAQGLGIPLNATGIENLPPAEEEEERDISEAIEAYLATVTQGEDSSSASEPAATASYNEAVEESALEAALRRVKEREGIPEEERRLRFVPRHRAPEEAPSFPMDEALLPLVFGAGIVPLMESDGEAPAGTGEAESGDLREHLDDTHGDTRGNEADSDDADGHSSPEA